MKHTTRMPVLKWMGLVFVLSLVLAWIVSIPWVWSFQRFGDLYCVDQPDVPADPARISFDSRGRASTLGYAYQMHFWIVLRNGYIIRGRDRELSIRPPGSEWIVVKNPFPRPYLGWANRLYSRTYFPLWPLVILILIPTGLLWFLDRRAPRVAPHCKSCGYNLTGNKTGICPECGEEI